MKIEADTEAPAKINCDRKKKRSEKTHMKRKNISRFAAAAVLLSLCLTGCGETKVAKDARQQGITQMAETNYAGAITSFDTALEEADGIVNKFELDILKYRGEAEFNLGDYAAAKHTYDILVDVDKGQPEYLYLRAASGALSGDVESALEDYNKAADMEKPMDRNVVGSAIALSSIGKACTDKGDYEQAIDLFNKAIEAGVADAGVYNQMGQCMVNAKRYEEAIGYFDQGIALGNTDIIKELSYNKAAAYEYKGDFAKALELLKSYTSLYGSTPEIDKEITFLESR